MSERKKYQKVTDAQKAVLERHFEAGMKDTKSSSKDLHKEASRETGLDEEKVKKWISNERKKRKKPVEEGQDVIVEPEEKKARVPPYHRGPSRYNIFCSEFFKYDECKSLSTEGKYKLAAERWKNITPDESEKYSKKAKQVKSLSTTENLTDSDRKKLVEKHRKQLFEQIYFLEDLGCETSVLFLEGTKTSPVHIGGSTEGTSFLNSNPDVSMRFAQYFSVDSKRYTYKDVQDLFNRKYSDAIGKKGCRVPYFRGGFSVQNLPEGIDFKKPFNYGNSQITQIMAAKDNIRFVIDTEDQVSQSPAVDSAVPAAQQEEPQPTAATPPEQPVASVHTSQSPAQLLIHQQLKSAITKIIGEGLYDVIFKSASAQDIIEEKNVEVEALCLSQAERLALLAHGRPHFEPDAWVAVGANIQREEPEKKGIILAVYTDDLEACFWLFYTERPLKNILSIKNNAAINGYWLDVTDNINTYTVLKQPVSIWGRNLIKDPQLGPLYYLHHLEEGHQFHAPELFPAAIFSTLYHLKVLKPE